MVSSLIVFFDFVLLFTAIECAHYRKGCEHSDLVSLDEAKTRWPEMVIDYLVGHLKWTKKK